MVLRHLVWAALAGMLLVPANGSSAADDPYWDLVHDRAVVADLKLSAEQLAAWHGVLDPLDLQVFSLRNKAAAEAQPAAAKAIEEARTGLADVLTPNQRARLEAIRVRMLGSRALADEQVAKQLKLTETQRGKVTDQLEEIQSARAELQKQADKSPDEKQKEWDRIAADERAAIQKLLTAPQLARLREMLAADFDTSSLGQSAYKAPELVGEKPAWLQSEPLALSQLSGKVVVVHFFAFGCINCIHNYPSYRKWQEELASQGVVLVGIHTPETKAEHNTETLVRKLKEEKLAFPVLVDNDHANWNAWGNNVWPAVYLIDKQGYFRSFWPGELNWEGKDGAGQMRKQIEKLLAEGTAP
jgi:thiol-disulfide isomerase/thioredoxin